MKPPAPSPAPVFAGTHPGPFGAPPPPRRRRPVALLVGLALVGLAGAGALVRHRTRRPSPAVVAVAPAVDLGAGDGHTCARFAGGAVRCWGSNADGQLGDGTTVSRARPGRVVFAAGR